MKTWITQTVAGVLTLAAIGITACKKDEVQATLTPTNTATLAASTNSVVLTQANASQTAVTYTFSPITFAWTNTAKPYNPNVVYTLQLDKQGNNFASAVTIDAGSGPTKAVSVSDLNSQLLALGLTPGKATALDVRLKEVYAANEPIYSPTVTLTATPYAFCAQPSPSQAWSIIGPAGKGWSTDIIMTYDCATKTFTYTGPLNADEFKFRYGGDDPVTGSWKANLGGASSTGGALTQDGPNLKIATAGTYTVTLTPPALDASGKAGSGGSFTIK